MKKSFKHIIITSIVCIAVCSTLSVKAQFSPGIRAGANFATEPVNGFYHVFLARPYVGVFGQYNLGSSVGVQLGVNYSGEGANYKDLSNNDVYHVRHSFITIPLLVQYKFGFGGYIEAGPQLGFLIAASAKYNDQASQNTKDYYKGTDMSVGGGIGYDFKKSLQGWGLSLRYMRGVTNLNKTAVDADNQAIRSRVLSAGITYKLPVSGK
ncbi:porin family protein [Mucilaginibacter sp. CAU 1740]|uniref:porin family protein n=1 Tax=Mucilaginibacter sp. CAU 1740 TaxID=3140365 RepID=UPI00325C04A5